VSGHPLTAPNGAEGDAAPLVDVMLLVYKRVRYVRAALESVLAQTFGGWRAIVWDNGPGSEEIRNEVVDLLEDARVTYRATGREQPLAANWTEALGYGTARYVGLLSDDDVWYPRFLANRVEALEAHPACGFAFSECDRIDEAGHVFHRVPARLPQGVVSRETLARQLRSQDIVTPSTLLARRSAYETVGPAYDGAWRYSDWEMVARLAAGFPGYYVPVRDNATRTHTQRVTSLDASDPDELLAMADHIDALFTRSVPGYRVVRRPLARASHRSGILLRSAHDSHVSGGWPASRRLYLRALREFPPVAFKAQAVVIGGERLLGRRAFEALRQTRRSIRRRLRRTQP
jgi:glycosyltransferase involved in cell wall biosynthesis